MKLLLPAKLLLSALAAMLALVWLAPDDADARTRTYRKKHQRDYATYQRPRPPSIADNGLCQRDTGTPTSNLNFRNRCDTEEFWQRQQDRGSGWR